MSPIITNATVEMQTRYSVKKSIEREGKISFGERNTLSHESWKDEFLVECSRRG